MDIRPSVSIITVNYNNVSGLKKTIKSVLSQVDVAVQYIIIDGGSTDGSKELLKQNSTSIFYWVSEKDDGIYHAMNKGIQRATGEYLMFLNSGDCFCTADVLKKCSESFERSPNADFYFGDVYFVNIPNQDASFKRLYKHPSQLSLAFFKKTTINHQACLIKASLFKEFGLYPENYKYASDYWMFLLSYLNDKTFIHVDFPMVDYDLSGVSSINREIYTSEKQLIWSTVTPKCVQELVSENEGYEHLLGYRILKVARKLNDKFQKVRNR